MSFQAYLDSIEQKTGLTPRQLIDLAHERGFDASTKATPILEWLRDDYGIAVATPWPWCTSSPRAPASMRSTSGARGTHRDESDVLWLDGAASCPQ